MGAGQDQDAFRKALEAADFASNRGDFAFGPNGRDVVCRHRLCDGLTAFL